MLFTKFYFNRIQTVVNDFNDFTDFDILSPPTENPLQPQQLNANVMFFSNLRDSKKVTYIV